MKKISGILSGDSKRQELTDFGLLFSESMTVLNELTFFIDNNVHLVKYPPIVGSILFTCVLGYRYRHLAKQLSSTDEIWSCMKQFEKEVKFRAIVVKRGVRLCGAQC